jgi:hypothetical protein
MANLAAADSLLSNLRLPGWYYIDRSKQKSQITTKNGSSQMMLRAFIRPLSIGRPPSLIPSSLDSWIILSPVLCVPVSCAV